MTDAAISLGKPGATRARATIALASRKLVRSGYRRFSWNDCGMLPSDTRTLSSDRMLMERELLDQSRGAGCQSVACRDFMRSKIQWHFGSKSTLMRLLLFCSMAGGVEIGAGHIVALDLPTVSARLARTCGL